MARFNSVIVVVPLVCLIMLDGCQDMLPRDVKSLLLPEFRRSDLFGFVAGLGTTFAALPDLISMLRRRSSAGMNPRMAAIIGAFQIDLTPPIRPIGNTIRTKGMGDEQEQTQ